MNKITKSDSLPNYSVLDEDASETNDLEQYQAAAQFDTLHIGSTIKNRFILVSELGRGGMGVVFKARDLRKEEAQDRNPYVAVKVLSEDFKNNPDSFIALQRETRKAQDLAHPNIVTVYDFDKDGPHVYMTMEYLDGKPLSELLKEDITSKAMQERWSIVRQTGMALAYAHKKNIIHLDLKPGNIFVKKDGIVKVLDFGIACAAKNQDQTQTAGEKTVFDPSSLGALTPSYASCEMLENEEPDFRDDVYALGCVAYEVLGGRHPFNKVPATRACFNKAVVEPINAISKKQHKALVHCLAFARKERTPSVFQFLQEAQLINPEVKDRAVGVWPLVIAVVIAVIVAVLYARDYFIVEDTLPDEPQKQETYKVLTPKEKEKVRRILEVAEIHLMVGRLTEPSGSSAWDAFKLVLSIDPRNAVAKQGIRQIADRYLELARETWNQEARTKSMQMLERGLRVMPTHKGLLKFKQMAKDS